MKRFAFPAPVLATIRQNGHKPFCFAGQPAPCSGYFENDVLPCVCGATQDVLSALQQVQVPMTPVVETRRRNRASCRQPKRQGRKLPGCAADCVLGSQGPPGAGVVYDMRRPKPLSSHDAEARSR
jgi:hypothetical protein